MSQEDKPVAPNPDEVICPSCCHQFRAIPQNVQRLMLNAGFEPPFTQPVSAQEPFCYMSDQFEVGLFTEPPTDPVFADMFPVYRNQIDAQAKITEQAMELSRETTARKWAVESLEQYKAECTQLYHDVDRLSGENQQQAARIKALEAEAADRESFIKTLADICTEAERIAIERAGRIDVLESELSLIKPNSDCDSGCMLSCSMEGKANAATIERQRKVIEDVKQFINTPISVESCARMNAAIAELERGVA